MNATFATRRNGRAEWEPPPYDGIPDGPSGPEDVIRAFDPTPAARGAVEVRDLELTCAASLAGKPVPEGRRHLVDGIPLGDITLLAGDGGAGIREAVTRSADGLPAGVAGAVLDLLAGEGRA